jgi:tetratricopeptide (TPR) repeat protein
LRSLTEEVVERKLAQGQGHTLTDEDRAFLRSVQQQWEAFAGITGDDAESRSIRAEGYARVGLMRHRLGDLKDAEVAHREALAIRQQLAADFPTRPDFRQELATSHNKLGVLLCDTGRLAEAEAAYREALALRQQLAADFPTRPDFRQELATSHNNLGALLRDTARLQEAEVAYREALALFKQLVLDFPTRPDFRRDLAASHLNLGNLLYQTGRVMEAEADWREAVAVQKQLVADFPTRPDFRQELAISHNNLGILLCQTGRIQEAEAAWCEALALQKQLAAEFPTRPDFRRELAISYLNLGNLLSATGRLQETEAAWRDALVLFKQLAADFPDQPDMRNGLAATLVNLAILGIGQRDFVQAKDYLDLAQPHHQAALKANPRHPTYRQSYRSNLWALAQAQAGLLDRAAAVKTAEQIRDLGWNPEEDAYDAACALALCIPIVEKHEKLDAQERQAAVQFYGDEAMKLLGDAVSKGFKDAGRIRAESDLAPLRNRDDFQKLLADLEAQPEKPPAQDGKSK